MFLSNPPRKICLHLLRHAKRLTSPAALNTQSFLWARSLSKRPKDGILNTEHTNVDVICENNSKYFFALLQTQMECNGMICNLMLYKHEIQPIREQESLYTLYNNFYLILGSSTTEIFCSNCESAVLVNYSIFDSVEFFESQSKLVKKSVMHTFRR